MPESDVSFLNEKGFEYSLTDAGSEQFLTLKAIKLPTAYRPESADVLIRIPAGYPLAPLDMFYTFPTVTLANGQSPEAAQVQETLAGKVWQRWSRHRTWRPGVDDLRAFINNVFKELQTGT